VVKNTIAIVAGDGIGPEVTAEAVKALHAVERRLGLEFHLAEMPVGWAAIDQYGEALPAWVREACAQSDAVFLGAVGLPERDAALPQDQRPERAVLLPLRAGNFANLRPVWRPPCMSDSVHPPVDMLIVRELTGGLYTGTPRGRREVDGHLEAFDTMRYSVPEIERVARVAFEAARQRRRQVCSVDKANMLASSALWRETVERLAAEYPDVELRHQLVDSAALLLVRAPQQFDVLLTENMFGDILSDLAGILAGSLGMLPSAAIGGAVPFFEPAHGTAPELRGRNVANPIATILAMAMMLDYALHLSEAADLIRRAVIRVLVDGFRTIDIMADGCARVGTSEFGDRVVAEIEAA
jgi:3-isopropylmalate dehydrogenase